MGGATGSRRIHAQPRNKKVDRAGSGDRRNAGRRCPGGSIAGSAQDQVIGGAVLAEATIRPDHVNVPRAVDSRGGQSRAAQTPGLSVLGDLSDGDGLAPTGAPIARTEGYHRAE